MARHSPNAQEEVLGEILIRFEGSSTLNRVATFKTPITGRSAASEESGEGQLEFESRVLLRNLIDALKKLM